MGDEGSMEVGALVERLDNWKHRLKQPTIKGQELHVLAVQDGRGFSVDIYDYSWLEHF